MSKINSPLRLKKKYSNHPLWMMAAFTIAKNLIKGVINRYPLADPTDSLSCQPLFIISAGRSGTTLLRSMLVAGDQIAIPPETQILHQMAVKFLSAQGLGWPDLSRLVIASFESHHHYFQWDTNLFPAYEQAIALPKKEYSLARLIDIVYTLYADKNFPGATVWGDQSPLHTFYLPWIQPVFPKARYLHMLRDGRDVISSMVERRGPAYLEDATRRWIKSIDCVAKLRKNIDAKQFLEVRYEDLVTEPTQTLQKVCNYIGISYAQKMLDFWKLPSTLEHKHHSFHRNLSNPVFTSSRGKWRERLTEKQQKYVVGETSALLESLGYSMQ